MSLVKYEVPFDFYQRSSPAKFASVAAAAGLGDANAIVVSPTRDMLRRGIEIGYARYVNNSGSNATMALAGRLRQAEWVAGQVTAAGVYTADTTAAQNATTGDFQMHDRSDDGSGFIVGASIPWNVLSAVVSAAGDQTVTTEIVEYWNGTAWTDIEADLLVGSASPNLLYVDSTGEKLQMWDIPTNWVVGGTPVATVPQDKFNIRFRLDTSAPGTADPTASQLFVGVSVLTSVSVASGAGNAIEHNPTFPVRLPRQCDALFGVQEAVDFATYFHVSQRFYW